MASVKIPPHNEEAEQSVLGGILLNKDAIGSVSEVISPGDFYNDINGMIFSAMTSLQEEGKPIDVLTVSARLKKEKKSDKVEASYLADLVNSVPTAANIVEYAELIKEASTRRALISLGGEIAELAFLDDKDVPELLDKTESSIFAISKGSTTKGFIALKDTLAESFDRIDELHNKGAGLRGVETGFTDLDNLLSGMQKSNLLILAARPGQGKTAMMINIAQHVAVVGKKPVGIFSLEMSQEELVDRLLVGQADVDAWRLKTGKLSETDFTKLSEAMGVLADAPIFIDDTPGASVSEIRTKARRLQLEHDVSLIVVDYLQLVDPGKRYDNRVQEVSVVSQALKNLARELKIPVLAVSQLSRAVEHRGERKPQLADLRESGAIEQDSDVVMFIYRPDFEISNVIQTKLLIAKHRNGPMGEIDLLFRGDRIRFYNVDKKREGETQSE
ncbi:MAG: replicative DNA helicase [Candidatus Levybacteria bacterium RIFOXYA1_FULL_41_10]|nr:MAG: Replicative DNA helicase [Candidatus Levybacteria bacterium GW2011_GWA1_39_32]KKR50599.1 MAG: Replicative DNA helicase [Candidatus Levybacteria bacterium GW2011_GWC1_40_19]KKR94680.1 MAG: Replicative DNA helicase [Candidatus Levybacteria bacterium GW2011_GWA2_41_15]KKS01725.1 MAG: Replicative DNA helicase [Candidatus Levybacteria bacterium GW2011_GWB1_41_21]OGH20197.1 MAG: replicative DNA helicase [Candidatus Levybacteria bacterium RIFCSPHIGHO2_01_FULL_40_83]OGH25906.1 MAG: replicative